MAVDQIIRRMQTELQTLQATNQRLLNANKEAMAHLQNCDAMARALTKENHASRRVIWAMAHSNGGEIRIPDDSMRAASDDKNQITSRYDPEKCETVIGAIEAKHEPEKGESDDEQQGEDK